MAAGRPRLLKRSSPPFWRLAAAALFLLVLVGGVVWLLGITPRGGQQERLLAPAALVQEVATRAGLEGHRVQAKRLGRGENREWEVSVEVPPGFNASHFLLALQAAAHNHGGRLDPSPVPGGEGDAALAGTLGSQRFRVVLRTERPRQSRTPRKFSQSGQRPQLALVLDDAGHSLADVEALAALPREVAVAVLPNAAYARQVAEGLGRQGREVLIHLPMEPADNGAARAGEGAILVSFSEAEVRRRVEAARRAVPGAVGVNNHMGSRATSHEPTMAAVMAALAGQGLYFLDSRTTAASVALAAAQRAGIPALARDVFLDVVGEEPEVKRALNDAAELARSKGSAVAIGHVHPTTVAVLRRHLAASLGDVELVPPSQLARSSPSSSSSMR